MDLDKFSLPSDEVTALAGGPNRGICWIQLSRFVRFENVSENFYSFYYIYYVYYMFFKPQEAYIVQYVDLLSGLGGAMGLWLGWSVLSLGNSIVKALRTVTSVKLFK